MLSPGADLVSTARRRCCWCAPTSIRAVSSHHQHPDKNPAKADEFKDLSHAYDVLSDPQKREVRRRLARPRLTRQLYDRYGEKGLSGDGGMGGMDPTDLFSSCADPRVDLV